MHCTSNAPRHDMLLQCNVVPIFIHSVRTRLLLLVVVLASRLRSVAGLARPTTSTSSTLGEGSVVKKRIFRILARIFLPQNLYLDPNPDRTAEKKYEANALI